MTTITIEFTRSRRQGAAWLATGLAVALLAWAETRFQRTIDHAEQARLVANAASLRHREHAALRFVQPQR
ncbi:hypothetical protein EYE40_06450 [Glaciihabitans arcticus]|uniref:Uncharacterized protein n=1 Tax=Glaciihabitans arcticus TaxID=2668039 RepID=A0A4V2JEV5_9MICO|nr:hypothetical protein [Glaciihabitans arcticus]TBN57069.1 hypothetical protein EYE40_06450 [Glaciihabitans arcticus]